MTVDPMDDYEPVAPEHHDQPMLRIRANYRWEGESGKGFSVDTYYYRCRSCDTECTVQYKIPS